MKKPALLLLALPLAAARCGTYSYQKADTSQTQFAREAAACENYAMGQPPASVVETSNPRFDGAANSNAAKQQKDMNSCMAAKGYTVEHTSALRPPNDTAQP